MSVAAGERWDIALGADGQWRPVNVLTVRGDQVEVRYLDMGTAPDSMSVTILSRHQMLENKTRYRKVGGQQP
ncbi:MAG TPA: hypothetical protein VKZ79_00555 [Alphaproteobacteria bacterium]|nr:hypothetical protein [Alphaproteobacteria bacterium]